MKHLSPSLTRQLKEHIRLVYPSADARVVLRRAEEAVDRAGQDNLPPPALFHHVHAVVRALYPTEQWQRNNALAVTSMVERAGNDLTNWHTWSDLQALCATIQAMSLGEQHLLRLTTVEPIDDEGLAVILGTTRESASAQLADALARFRALYADRTGSGS